MRFAILAILATLMTTGYAYSDVVIKDGVWEPGSLQCVVPRVLEVAINDTVVWYNTDSASHRIIGGEHSPDGSFYSGLIPSGGTFSHTFDQPGTYPYYCQMRPSLGGTITVLDEISPSRYGPPLQGNTAHTLSTVSPMPEKYDIHSPAVLAVVVDDASFTALAGARGLGVYSVNSADYVIVAGSDNDGIQVVDVGRDSPKPVGSAYSWEAGGIADPYDIDAYVLHDKIIAAITTREGSSVQILDVTIPGRMVNLGMASDGEEFTALGGASHAHITTIKRDVYAIITSHEGIQIIDPVHITPISAMHLDHTRGLDTVKLDAGYYAAAAVGREIQIINITNPFDPSVISVMPPAFGIPDDILPRGVSITSVDSGTYALITWSSEAASESRDGLQIVNMTDVLSPHTVSWVVDSKAYQLDGAYDIATVTLGSHEYALVTSYRDGGLQIMDISNIVSISPVSWVPIDGATDVDFIQGKAVVSSYDTDALYLVGLGEPEGYDQTSTLILPEYVKSLFP